MSCYIADATQARAFQDTARTTRGLLEWLSTQLIGQLVRESDIVPVRFNGRALPLRVVSASAASAGDRADASTHAANHAPIEPPVQPVFRVTPSTALSLVQPPPPRVNTLAPPPLHSATAMPVAEGDIDSKRQSLRASRTARHVHEPHHYTLS